MVVFNTPVSFEVAQNSFADEVNAGVMLQYDVNGLLNYAAAGSAHIDAILISDVLNNADYLNRYYIYNEVEWGPYVRIGEPVSVAKAQKVTANMLAVNAPAAIPAGSALEIGANGVLQLKNTGAQVATAIDAIAQNATMTGAVHVSA